MKPEHDIERLIKNVDINTNADRDKAVLADVLEALEESKKKPAVIEPNRWRTIMKSRITKLGAVAVIIGAVLIGAKVLTNSIQTREKTQELSRRVGTVAAYDLAVFNKAEAAEADECREFPKSETVWGATVNGLRSAVEFVPEKEFYALGEVIGIRFHVQNVSDSTIQFTTTGDRRNGGICVKDANGQEQHVISVKRSGSFDVVRKTLSPGQEVLLESESLSIGQALEPASSGVGHILRCQPGCYFVRGGLLFPNATSSDMPQQGDDWQGELETGERVLVVTPAPEALLGQALRKFCAEKAKGKKILLCLCDIEQNSSQDSISALARRVEVLEKNATVVLLVNTSDVEIGALNEWVSKNGIPFAPETIQGQSEDAMFIWGVEQLPWFVLLDEQRLLHSAGFGLEKLEEKLTSSAEPMSLNPRQTLGVFLAAGYGGEDEEAKEFVHPRSEVESDIDDLRKIPGGQNMEIVDVYADNWSALALSSVFQVHECGERVLSFELVNELGTWLLTKIDGQPLEEAEQKTEAFLRKHPEAKMIPR